MLVIVILYTTLLSFKDRKALLELCVSCISLEWNVYKTLSTESLS